MDQEKNIVFKKNRFISKGALLSFCALCQAVHIQHLQAEENSDNPHGEFYLEDHSDGNPDKDYYMKDHAIDDELAMEGDTEENSDNPHGEFYLEDHSDRNPDKDYYMKDHAIDDELAMEGDTDEKTDRNPDKDYYMKDHAIDDELAMEGDTDEKTEFLIEDKKLEKVDLDQSMQESVEAKKFFSLNIPFFREQEVEKEDSKKNNDTIKIDDEKNDKNFSAQNDVQDSNKEEGRSFFGLKIPFFTTEGKIERDIQTEEEGLKTDFENNKRSIEEISSIEESSLIKEQDLVIKTFRVVLEPYFKTQISAEIKTTVLSVNKKMGDSFKKGDILINLDADLYLAELNRAQAFFDKSQAEYDALKQLFQKNIASKVEVESAKAARVSALSDLIMANRSFERCFIKAPYDGNVVEVFVQDYEHVDVSSPLVLVQDDTKLIAKLVVPSSVLESIQEGKELPLFKQDPKDVLGYAIIKRIGAHIDPSSGLVKVDAEVENVDKKLLPGMVVNVQISGYNPAI